MSRPIFENDEGLATIDERFGTVTRDTKSCLSEPLALEATIEFFCDKKSDLYEKRMIRLLGYLQNDASGFGKAAEWYLARVSCRYSTRRCVPYELTVFSDFLQS